MEKATDGYAATASAYDLFNASSRPGQEQALEALLPLVRTDAGPVLDVGAGSGLNIAFVLEHLPEAFVFALEPSPAMRALALAKIAAHPEWFDRVTLRPEDVDAADLPEHIGGAILLGVLGHFDPGARAALFAELATRLPIGGAALFDLQAPERPRRVEAFEFTAARIGELDYRCIAEAWPAGRERMRWRMTYLSVDGERILTEDTVEHVYHHPAPETVAAEADQVGLRLRRVGDGTFWLLLREA